VGLVDGWLTVLAENFGTGGDAFTIVERTGGDAFKIGFNCIECLMLFLPKQRVGGKGGLGIHTQGLAQGVC
jgi:hypothetical protein